MVGVVCGVCVVCGVWCVVCGGGGGGGERGVVVNLVIVSLNVRLVAVMGGVGGAIAELLLFTEGRSALAHSRSLRLRGSRVGG